MEKSIINNYEEKISQNHKNILLISEENSLHFLEKKFEEHKSYRVINESIENIEKIGIDNYIKAVVGAIKKNPKFFDGVTGFFDTPSAVASVICHMTGKVTAPLESVIKCQNKFACRELQQQSVPLNTPKFYRAEQFLKEQAKFPCFLKPFRAARSFSSTVIHSRSEYQEVIEKNMHRLKKHNQTFIRAVQMATNDSKTLQYALESNDFLIEDTIRGDQYCVNGYIQNKSIHIHGIIKEVFFKDTMSFERHEFPCGLPNKWLEKIHTMTQDFISHTGLDNTEFDIEFRIDEENDQLKIIELNPRAVVQYENLFELVNGEDMLSTICALSCNDIPPATKKPSYKHCYSCELRMFEDQKIIAIPDIDNIRSIQADYPGIKIVNRIHPNSKKLSDYTHTKDSYRYCIISIPGNDKQYIMDCLENVKRRLNYQFSPA